MQLSDLTPNQLLRLRSAADKANRRDKARLIKFLATDLGYSPVYNIAFQAGVTAALSVIKNKKKA